MNKITISFLLLTNLLAAQEKIIFSDYNFPTSKNISAGSTARSIDNRIKHAGVYKIANNVSIDLASV